MTQFPNYFLNKPSGLQCNTEVTATPFCPEIHLNSDFQSASLYDKKPDENFYSRPSLNFKKPVYWGSSPGLCGKLTE